MRISHSYPSNQGTKESLETQSYNHKRVKMIIQEEKERSLSLDATSEEPLIVPGRARPKPGFQEKAPMIQRNINSALGLSLFMDLQIGNRDATKEEIDTIKKTQKLIQERLPEPEKENKCCIIL